MKKFVYTILQVIILIAAISISLWTLEEATKLIPPSWIDLLYVWTIVLWVISILSIIFRKKILQMKGYAMAITIICCLCIAGAIIDTYYAIDIISQDIILTSKINQSLLCIGLWAVSAGLLIYSRRLVKK